MKIQPRLIILFVGIALIPLIFITSLIFINYQADAKKLQASHLEAVSILKAGQIELIFDNLKAEIATAQGYWNIKTNFPIVNKNIGNRQAAPYLAAKKILDSQLRIAQKNWRLFDIMLLNQQGVVVYCSDPKHSANELGKRSLEIDDAAFLGGSERITFSDVFRDPVENQRMAMAVTAPAYDNNNNQIGVIAFIIDLGPIYQLIQDPGCMGKTGETLIVKQFGEEILFLNPLRFDPEAALARKVRAGDRLAGPAQSAVLRKSGVGVATDYRGREVLARWTYLPTPGWGTG